MIVQESRIKTRSGAGALSRHVLHGVKNEAIRVLAGSDWLMRDAMREARRERLTYGLRHLAFNPDEAMSDDQLAGFARRLCEELHADPEHITLVVHQKDGSTHGHLILPSGSWTMCWKAGSHGCVWRRSPGWKKSGLAMPS
jgi:hypothetical protein